MWLWRVPRSTGKESRFEEKEPSSDEKEPCEALSGVKRGSFDPALGTKRVAFGSGESHAWLFYLQAEASDVSL